MSDSPLKQNRIVPIDKLKPHPRNYRGHPDSQVSKLVSSLVRFGQGRSIVIQDGPEGYIIVAGHGIVEAAKKLDYTELRADILPANWTSEQVDGYLVADNMHSQDAEDDQEMLVQILQEQKDAGFALESIGSDDESLRQLLESLGNEYLKGDEGEDEEEDFEAEPDEEQTRVKLGDVWQLGEHRLLAGDCTKVENVQKLMQGEYAECCWTDPPYGVSYVGKTKDALTIQNDGKEDLDNFLKRAFVAIDTALKDGAAIYIAHPPGVLCLTFGNRFVAQGWKFHQTLIWVKDSMVLGHSDYHFRHEPIYFGYKPGKGRLGRGGESWHGDDSQKSVFEIPRPKRSEEHPTMKPIELIQEMLQNSCPRGGLVYEPFGGSGSTLIAAHQLKMRCNICELDPKYANVCISRWEQLTGQQATLLDRAEEVVHA